MTDSVANPRGFDLVRGAQHRHDLDEHVRILLRRNPSHGHDSYRLHRWDRCRGLLRTRWHPMPGEGVEELDDVRLGSEPAGKVSLVRTHADEGVGPACEQRFHTTVG